MKLLDKSKRLRKELGLFDVFAVSMGAMMSSGFFLLPGLAAAKTGPSVVLAYIFAGFLMIPATLSQAELSTAMPRAGGSYYFIDRSLGPLAGTVGGLGTWFVMALKSTFALIGMGAYVGLVLDLPARPVALALVAVFTLINILGVKQTIGFQTVLVLLVLGIMSLFVTEGAVAVARDPAAAEAFSPFLSHGWAGLMATVGFVVISFAGLTNVASIAEEVKNPERNLPLGMILSLATACTFYVLGVGIMVVVLDPGQLHGDLTPVATAAAAFSRWVPAKVAVGGVVLAAAAGFAAAGNAAMMSASRYPLAMARDHLISPRFANVHPRLGTPIRAVIVTAVLMIAAILLLSEEGVAKLASSMQLLLFGLISLAVIVMRESRIDSYDPGFRSPFYPWLQLAGIGASLWLIVQIGAMSILFTGGLVLLGIAWYFWYACSRVSRSGAVLHVFARLGRRQFHGLDSELRSIMKEKGLREQDPFDEVVARAYVVDAGAGATFEELAGQAARLLEDRLPLSAEELREGFLEGTRVGATPVSHGAALPHTRVKGAEHPELVLVRVGHGLFMESLPPGGDADRPVHAIFFLASPEGDPAQHLRLLAQIAGRVDDDGFIDEWLGAHHEAKLREVLLRDERYMLVRVEEGAVTADLAGKSLKELHLPHGCLVALVRRPDDGTHIPDGSTVIELGDRLTVIGEPDCLSELHRRFQQ